MDGVCNLTASRLKYRMIFWLFYISWPPNHYILLNLHSLTFQMAYCTQKFAETQQKKFFTRVSQPCGVKIDGSYCNSTASRVKYSMIFWLCYVSWPLNHYILRNLHSLQSFQMVYFIMKSMEMQWRKNIFTCRVGQQCGL